MRNATCKRVVFCLLWNAHIPFSKGNVEVPFKDLVLTLPKLDILETFDVAFSFKTSRKKNEMSEFTQIRIYI